MLTTTRDLTHCLLQPGEHANNKGSNPQSTTPRRTNQQRQGNEPTVYYTRENMLTTTRDRTHGLLHPGEQTNNDKGTNPQSKDYTRENMLISTISWWLLQWGKKKFNQHYKQNREMYVTCHSLHNRLVWLKVHVI